jgi:ferrochelatase
MTHFLLVNFGGPRHLDEIFPFLQSLLCDRDVVRTRLPAFLHNLLFTRVARKRTLKIAHDYNLIGGRSPIYFDTEALAVALSKHLFAPVLTFHRYLPATHAASLERIRQAPRLTVLPLFPQFSYATTGSIARFLKPLPVQQLRWIKSYAAHPAFIAAYQRRIADFLQQNNLDESDTILFCSAHGLPQTFIETGDPYESECNDSFQAIMRAFPNALGRLCYQSKFGKGEWLRPYTDEASDSILTWHQGRKNVVFVPISFTSDHIETLFEIEQLYLPLIVARGLHAYRCPALNLEPYWIEALVQIMKEPNLCNTQMLIRD